jgi:DNA-binding response OmpR family regulator
MNILLVTHQSSGLREAMEETLRASGNQVELADSDSELAADLKLAAWDFLIADVSVDRESVLRIVESVCATEGHGETKVVVAGERQEMEADTAARLPFARIFCGFTRSDTLMAALRK